MPKSVMVFTLTAERNPNGGVLKSKRPLVRQREQLRNLVEQAYVYFKDNLMVSFKRTRFLN